MRVLDLFCGAGGAGMGYHQAGFDVVGVDIDTQRAYPFRQWRNDALSVLERLIAGERLSVCVDMPLGLDDFDLIHASPPCQGYTSLKAVHGNEWPLLIEPVRDLLNKTNKPYVIENVQGAPVRRDMTLCGEMFGLGVIRHRYFELGNWSAKSPAHIPHRGNVRGWNHYAYIRGPYVAVYGSGGGKATITEAQEAMGIDWMTERHDLNEAIPPAYTRHIGQKFLGQHLLNE